MLSHLASSPVMNTPQITLEIIHKQSHTGSVGLSSYTTTFISDIMDYGFLVKIF